MPKTRLDVRMVEVGLVQSRSLAQKMILAGQVRVNGAIASKPSDSINMDDQILLIQGPKFVSRGGEKLEKALASFGFEELTGFICADVGVSTGGFTDCLLQHGANRIYAIDVGYGVLHWKIRNDSRVSVMEKTNARYVKELPEKIDLATIDASFISLKVLLPVVKNWLKLEGSIIALIKPQFEAGKKLVKKGGVVRDSLVHDAVTKTIHEFATKTLGLTPLGVIPSPLLGPAGNKEFLIALRKPAQL